MTDLFWLVDNFLISLENLGSKSTETRRAYALDLTQAFHFDKRACISFLTQRPLSERPKAPAIAAYPIDESMLAEQILAIQRAWGKLSLASRQRKGATLRSF